MNFENWVGAKVLRGEEATISLALLERSYPPEVPALRAIQDWANQLCKRLGCAATIHVASDVVTFYPRSKL